MPWPCVGREVMIEFTGGKEPLVNDSALSNDGKVPTDGSPWTTRGLDGAFNGKKLLGDDFALSGGALIAQGMLGGTYGLPAALVQPVNDECLVNAVDLAT